MATDFSSMKKLESLPGSVQVDPQEGDADVVVIVKLRPGAVRPDFLSPRAQIAPGLFSAEVKARDLQRIEQDPAVLSMSLSRRMPGID